jgi:hypothetical protein
MESLFGFSCGFGCCTVQHTSLLYYWVPIQRITSLLLHCCFCVQIMESLGGDQLWFDCFTAQHTPLLY